MRIASVDVCVDGVQSRVLTSGRADASEAVVFVHGNPGPADDWHDLLARAGELGRAVAPDMPGYGRADKPRGFAYTVEGYADYLAALLDQLHGAQRPRTSGGDHEEFYYREGFSLLFDIYPSPGNYPS